MAINEKKSDACDEPKWNISIFMKTILIPEWCLNGFNDNATSALSRLWKISNLRKIFDSHWLEKLILNGGSRWNYWTLQLRTTFQNLSVGVEIMLVGVSLDLILNLAALCSCAASEIMLAHVAKHIFNSGVASIILTLALKFSTQWSSTVYCGFLLLHYVY